MGISADAIVAYGFNLGGADDNWCVEEVAEDGGLTVVWYEPDDEGVHADPYFDFAQAAEDQLLTAAGFTETDTSADGYYERRRAALAAIGVEIITYCNMDYPAFALVTRQISVDGDRVERLDPAAMAAEVVGGDYDRKLREACRALGLTPKQTAPAWLLMSCLG